MNKLTVFLLCCFIISCIPTNIKPKIEDHKIQKAAKFKKKLPNDYAFIFEDPKEENEFHIYLNDHFKPENQDFERGLKIKIENQDYYMSFYETERTSKTINLVPILIDAKREQNGKDAILADLHTSRSGAWFFLINVFDQNGEDVFNPNHSEQAEVRRFLLELKNDYLSTQNYMVTYFEY